jgi:hypothetical protein
MVVLDVIALSLKPTCNLIDTSREEMRAYSSSHLMRAFTKPYPINNTSKEFFFFPLLLFHILTKHNSPFLLSSQFLVPNLTSLKVGDHPPHHYQPLNLDSLSLLSLNLTNNTAI